MVKGGGGVDIEPLVKYGVPIAGLWTDMTKYFWFHHTNVCCPLALSYLSILISCFSLLCYLMILVHSVISHYPHSRLVAFLVFSFVLSPLEYYFLSRLSFLLFSPLHISISILITIYRRIRLTRWMKQK